MKPIYESLGASFDREIYRLHSNLIAGPAATIWADSDFLATVCEKRPQTVFLKIDSELNVVDKSGEAFASLYDCLSVTKSFVPVIYIDDAAVTDKLVQFVYDNCVGDVTFCAPYDKRDILKPLFLEMPLQRYMLDCRAIADADWWYVCGQCWASKAISMLISAEQCTRETIDIIHERILSVWCDCAGDEIRVTFDGVDGVITDDVGGFYAMLDKLPENSMLDNYRVIAHKGFQDGYTEPENSIKAIKKGADHNLDGVEIDIKLSSDNIPFIIHNPTTKAMLEGDIRVIETLRSDELDTIQRTDFPGYCTDRFENMLKVIKPYERYQIYHEIKNFNQVEKSTHILKEIIDRYDMEYVSSILHHTDGIRYIQRYMPTLPKINTVTEKPAPPQNEKEANVMLFRIVQKITGTPAAFLLQDLMVNKFFGEAAAVRGYMTIVWTLSWYFKHSLWEEDGELSDEGFLAGYYSTISDHAERYTYIPKSIALNENNEPIALMRDGTKVPAENATCYNLGTKKTWGVKITLPHGLEYNIFSKAFDA